MAHSWRTGGTAFHRSDPGPLPVGTRRSGKGDVVVYRKIGDEVVLLAPSENGSAAAAAPKTISAEAGGPTVEAAVRGTSGEARIRDASGQDVWAIWRSLPALDIGILVKIGAAEAFAPLQQMKEDAVTVAGSVTCIAHPGGDSPGAVDGGADRGVEGRDAQACARQFLGTARESRITEIADLAQSFNSMAGQIKARTGSSTRHWKP